MNCPYWQGAVGGGGQCGGLVAGRLLATVISKNVTARVALVLVVDVVEIILDPEQKTLGVHHSRVLRHLWF